MNIKAALRNPIAVFEVFKFFDIEASGILVFAVFIVNYPLSTRKSSTYFQ
jgi:hypothetical protein